MWLVNQQPGRGGLQSVRESQHCDRLKEQLSPTMVVSGEDCWVEMGTVPLKFLQFSVV